MFYLDAFEQSRSRQVSVVGIYMSLANMPRAEYQRANSRVLLALVPKRLNLFDAIWLVIIGPMRLLEQGVDIPFVAEGVVRRCYGSAYAILGDHPSQMEMAGNTPIHTPLVLLLLTSL
jgi:hypothetical protein